MKLLSSLALCATMLFSLVGCQPQLAAQTDWDYIQSKGEMVMGITYFSPINYLDDSGKLVGFDTELAEVVCSRLGVKPKFQEIEWASKETELASKNIDAIWNGLSKTEQRANNMNLSRSYLKNAPVMIVRAQDVEKYKTARDLAGAVVVFDQGSVAQQLVETEAFFASAVKTPVDTQIKAFLELKANTAQIVVSDYVASIGYIGDGTDFANFVVSPYKSFDSEAYVVAFRKTDNSVVDKVNGVLNELIRDGTVASIAAKYRLVAQVVE